MKSIEVLGQTYKIRKESNPIDKDDKLPCDGYCNTDDHVIVVSKSANPDYADAILLHEIGHAIFQESGAEETGASPVLEEIIVEQYAKVLLKHFIIKPKK